MDTMNINTMNTSDLLALQATIKARLTTQEKEVKEINFFSLREAKRILYNALEKMSLKENLDLLIAGYRIKVTIPKENIILKSGIITEKNREVKEVKVKIAKEKFESIMNFTVRIAEEKKLTVPESIIKHNSTQSALVWLAKHVPAELSQYDTEKAAWKATA